MQGKGAHRVVRIGVLPGIRHGGVVDGQNLHNALTGFYRPVHQVLDVIEFAHTKAFLRAEGEDGDSHAGAAPGAGGELRQDIGYYQLRILRGNLREEMVGAFFPQFDFQGFAVHDDKLVLHRLGDIQGNHPPGEGRIREQMHLLPVSQLAAGAHQRHRLAAADLGGRDADTHVAKARSLLAGMAEGSAVRAAEDDIAEGR